MKGILPLILGAGAYFYFKSLKKLSENVKVKVTRADFSNDLSRADLYTNLYFKVNVQVSNPEAIGLTLKSLALNFFYKGRAVGSIFKNESLSVPAQNTVNALTTLKIPTFNIFQNVQQAVQDLNAGKGLDLQVTGKAEFEAGSILINEKIKAF